MVQKIPRGKLPGRNHPGGRVTVATLAKTLYTGPGSTPSQGQILSNGEAYLGPTGAFPDPLNTPPSAGSFAGWSYGSTPVAFSSVYGGGAEPFCF
ncbi:MAG: hypothetical protein IKT06_02090 [Aeriscardovia sp.]|nr:hypothetical protein [Aeriscardovia sp.]